MRLPNFLIIGAAKGGTTSLYHYLAQHPQIYMSPLKEPRFFALEGEELNFQNPDRSINHTSVTSLEEYCRLFDGVTNEIAIGEASPLYLYSNKAMENIARYIPEAKLVVILRNPVDRAYSCYKHLIALESGSFADALALEDHRIEQNWSHLWHYKQGGYYYKQLQGYFEKFDRKQIKVYLFDDLKLDPLELVQNLFSFLEVDDSFVPDLAYKNVSNNPKVKVLQNVVSGRHFLRSASQKIVPEGLRKNIAQQIRSWNSQEFEPLDREVKQQLTDGYRDDILKLQDLVGLNLANWLQ